MAQCCEFVVEIRQQLPTSQSPIAIKCFFKVFLLPIDLVGNSRMGASIATKAVCMLRVSLAACLCVILKINY